MKRLAIVCLLAGVAAADPITPPRGWIPDPPTADAIAARLHVLPHFGGVPSIIATEAYRAPTGGAALYLTRLMATVKPEDQTRAASAEIDELLAVARRANVKPDRSTQHVNRDARQLEAELGWRDAAVVTLSRIVIAADGTMITAVIGECVLAVDALPGLDGNCRAALATLDAGVAPASRVVLALVPPVSDVGEFRQPTSPSTMTVPRLGEGERPKLPPLVIPQSEQESDRRPFFVGGGLVVFATIFWWNRRRRELVEREDRDETRVTNPTAEVSDDDSDDLHAAANASDASDAVDDTTKEDKQS